MFLRSTGIGVSREEKEQYCARQDRREEGLPRISDKSWNAWGDRRGAKETPRQGLEAAWRRDWFQSHMIDPFQWPAVRSGAANGCGGRPPRRL